MLENDLTQEQLDAMQKAIHEAIGEPNDDQVVDDLDLLLAAWDAMELFNIPRDEIGEIVKEHGEMLVGVVRAKQLIGLL